MPNMLQTMLAEYVMRTEAYAIEREAILAEARNLIAFLDRTEPAARQSGRRGFRDSKNPE